METGGGPCSLVATPTKVDPLLPTLAVEAEYIMKKSSFVLGWDRNENRRRGSYSRARFWRMQLMGWSTQWPQKSDRRP